MDTIQRPNTKICILHETQKRWHSLLSEERIIYLYAMTGFGKTTQVLAFAREGYEAWGRFSACDEAFPEKLEHAMSGYASCREKTLLILDDLQWVTMEQNQRHLFEHLLELRKNPMVHIVLISRAAVPGYLKPLQVTRQMDVENVDALRFDEGAAQELLNTFPALAEESEAWKKNMAQIFVKWTRGYALGLNACFQRLDENKEEWKTAYSLASQDIHAYLSARLFGEWNAVRKDSAIRLSVYEHFSRAMAEGVLGKHAEAVLKDFQNVGSFLQQNSEDDYSFVSFFREFLEERLRERPRGEWLPIYETAASYYEQERLFEQALHCYQQIGRQDKVIELVVTLCENADGCTLIEIAQRYLDELSPDVNEQDPNVLGAEVLLAAYQMQPEECLEKLQKLKKLAEGERGRIPHGEAMSAYVRTLIACPYSTADQLKDNMLLFADYVKEHGFCLKNITPTGNMPSMLNGGLDLMSWVKNKKVIYPVVKKASEAIMGKEAVGIADVSMGEALYEQGRPTDAMSSLTKALSAAQHHGSVRVQYAATAVMARVFQAEGSPDTSEEILRNMQQAMEREHYHELIPNLHASLVGCALLSQDTLTMETWMKQEAPDEHTAFYINLRFQLMVKARVYATQGKMMDALYILNRLEEYAVLYKRTYLHMEILILKAIILYRRGEEWREVLLEAVEMDKPYGLVRIFADQGSALLPLWRELEDGFDNGSEETHEAAYRLKGFKGFSVITREMKRMAKFYPNYLKLSKRCEQLSKKELEVLKLISEGQNNTQIAKSLGVNLGTAKFHVANIMKKLKAENRTVAVKIGQEEGML